MQGYLFRNEEWQDDTGLTSAAGGISLADARYYQRQWADSTFATWSGRRACLGVAATGSGKTFYAGLVASRVLGGELDLVVPACKQTMLFIAPSTDLVDQSADGIAQLLPKADIEIEQGERRARGDCDIIVACLNSVSQQRRLNALGPDRFQAVVWDEFHKVRTGNLMFDRVYKFLAPETRHVGVTATPDRGDDIGPPEDFKHLAFDYDIGTAVEDGFLVRPYQVYEDAGAVTLDGCSETDGDFNARDVAQRMCEARPVAAVVKAAIKWSMMANGRTARRPTVVTCASVDHAKLVAVALNEWHAKAGTGRAAAIHSKLEPDDRRAAIQAFKAATIQYLTHYDCLTMGFDSEAKVVVNGRPTKKRWVYAQQAGRALRPARAIVPLLNAEPDAAARRAIIVGSDKPGAVIVDVCGTAHKLAVDLTTVMARSSDPQWVIDRARRRTAEKAAAGELADPEVDLVAVRREARAQRDRELAARWKGYLIGAELTTRHADPFDLLKAAVGREPDWVRGKRPSAKMKAVLIGAGIPGHEVSGMSFWAAKRMLTVIFDRRDAGLCSYKQAALLRKFGFDAGQMPFEDASALIDQLARNGWQAV